METTTQERTKAIAKLQKRHPNTRRQRNDHGADRYSVEFFDRDSGELVARYQLR